MNLLSVLVLIPLPMLARFQVAQGIEAIRGAVATGVSVLLIAFVVLTFMYLGEYNAGNTAEILFHVDTPWYAPPHISYSVGVDGISVAILLLSAVIVLTGTFASWRLQPLAEEYFLWSTLLSVGVFGFFISIDLSTMFMLYEVALIPIYLLIGAWGSGRKEYAVMRLTPTLMGGSILLLVSILGIYFGSGAITMNLLEIVQLHDIPPAQQCTWFPLTFLGSGALGALLPFHARGPNGYTSVPTAVSMLHVGVLMKLGGYGCFRITTYLMPEAANELSWIFPILTGISVVRGVFSAYAQADLRYINAYSSVSHCGLILFVILMLNQTTATGATLQILPYGLMTALFLVLADMTYGCIHTRDVRELIGLMKVIPFLSVCCVIAGLANPGLPGLSGLIAKTTISVDSFQNNDVFHRTLTIIACSFIMIAAVYILRSVGRIPYGTCTSRHCLALTDATWDERVAVTCLIVCVVGLGIAPFWVSYTIGEGVLPIVSQLIPQPLFFNP